MKSAIPMRGQEFLTPGDFSGGGRAAIPMKS
jgi:hypothetical protein